MIYFPYDNKSEAVQDRNVNSTQFASFIYKLCGYKSGIFETLGNKGVVKSKNGMTVTVEPLDGAIQGRLFDEVAVRELQLDTGGELDRIDTVVVRANLNDRTTDLYVTKGVEASLPTRPALKRSGGIHEIGLADIYIPKLTTTITDSRITDTRIDTDRMAILPVINSVDTSAIFNQYQSALDEYLALVQTAIDGTTAGNLQNQIDTTAGNLQNQIDTTAGNLQNQIGTLADLATDSKANIVKAVNENVRNVKINSANIVAKANKPKLLWTNPNPASAFAPQAINLDLSEIDEVLIDYGYQNTYGSYSTVKIPKGEAKFLSAFANALAFRQVTVSNTGVTFGSGEYAPAYGSSSRTASNDVVIPFRIYGIKTN